MNTLIEIIQFIFSQSDLQRTFKICNRHTYKHKESGMECR